MDIAKEDQKEILSVSVTQQIINTEKEQNNEKRTSLLVAFFDREKELMVQVFSFGRVLGVSPNPFHVLSATVYSHACSFFGPSSLMKTEALSRRLSRSFSVRAGFEDSKYCR